MKIKTKKSITKWIALALALVLMIGTLAGCKKDNTTDDSDGRVTIKFLHKGPKPKGWDEVYAKYLEMTKDTLNIALDITWVENADYKEKLNLEITSGSEWDLVFDASWVQLRNLAPEGYYADLSSYFNNPEEYPGLAKAFSADTMEANMWFGQMCYIPLFESRGNGVPVLWYRQDLAREWGIGTDGKINSYDEMEQFWQAAKDHNIIPYGASQSRGFYQQMTQAGQCMNGSAKAGLMQFSTAGLSVWVYVKDNKLLSYAVAGSGDENFKDFPEGFQYDFTMDLYDKFEEWQNKGFIDPDSLSTTDYDTPFHNGLSASVVGTMDDYVKYTSYEDTLGDGAIGFFVYEDAIRNLEKGGWAVDYSGNNGLCIPANSTKIPYTMKFLDWLFGSQEAHDLFQMGIEGRDFEYGDNGTYTTLTTYSADFGGFGWTWNPNYALISSSYTDEALKYRQYELSDDSYMPLPVLGFHFDTTDVDLSTAVAQCKAVTDMVSVIKLHGLTTDGNGVTYDHVRDMIKANTEQAMANGGQQVVDALIQQLTDFLATK